LKRLRVLVLYYQAGSEPADGVVTQVQEALTQNGHDVHGAAIHRDVDDIVGAVKRCRADLVFNICETFNEDAKLEANVAAVLELMGQPFTGSGQVGLILAQDKVLTKMVIAAHGVKAPSYVVFYPDRVELGDKKAARFPLLVKPSSLDASIGISAESLVHDWGALLERVRYVQDELMDAALAEEFIEGREFYLGVVGNSAPQALPILEMKFSGYEKGAAKIMTSDAKWDPTSDDFKRTKVVRPQRLSSELEASLQRIAVQVFRACHLRDYGRVDMRVRRGTPFVLEVNPNPYLEKNAEMATAAGMMGVEYPALIQRIVEQAWLRYHPEADSASAAGPSSQP
jgi:D-alanine-D-alanine ligase